jgi:TonB family protein
MFNCLELIKNCGRKAVAVMFVVGLFVAPQKGWAQGTAVKDNGGRKVKAKVNPEYPSIARESHITGTVRVEAVVKPDGKVSDVRVLGGSPILAQEVVTAVKNWQYGEGPKETTEIVEVSFGASK